VLARLIVQKNENGEKHITLTQDQVTPVKEMLITSPGWENSEVVEGRVLLILGIDEPDVILNELVDVELHTAWTQHPYISISPTLLNQLKGRLIDETV